MALGACSASVLTTKQVNTGKAEDLIRTFVQEKVSVPVGEVKCPARKAKQGDVFECTVMVEDQPLRVKVTQENDEGSVYVELAQAVLNVEKATTSIEQNVEKSEGFLMQVDCGPRRYLIKDPGSTFDCRIIDPEGGPVFTMVVTVKDVEGNIDARLA
ncbi:MAG: DUF4333 domain-containing protein [Acidimicrobiales bacterium]